MAYSHMCALCKSHSDDKYHSTYYGHPITKHVSWITRSTHWHSNDSESKTLAGIRAMIREMER